jgi:hypothetical protein
LAEVILKSGDFLNRKLAGRDQLSLFMGELGKAAIKACGQGSA